jgi:hypothetical protein
VLAAREEIVGIGHEGLIVRIARVKLRAGEGRGGLDHTAESDRHAAIAQDPLE